MGRRQVDIPTFRLNAFEKKAERLQKKARQIEEIEFSYNVNRDESYTEARNVVIEGERVKVPVEFVPVVIDGAIEESIEIDGWELIGAIDFGGSNVVRSHEDGLADRWGDTSSRRCDHCGHERARKTAYIVRDEDGHERQVGSTCLEDYLGHGSAEELARMYTSIRGIEDEFGRANVPDEMWNDNMRDRDYINLKTFLAIVDRIIQKHGWISGSEAYRNRKRSTKELAFRAYDDDRTRKRLFEEYPETDHDIEAIIEWARSIEDPDNDYLHNLKALAQGEMIHRSKHGGFAASMITAYEREHEDEDEQDVDSEWIGEEGERVEDKTLTLVKTKECGSRGYGYGRSRETTWLYKFRDEEGNVVVWFTTSAKSFPVDEDGEIVDEDETEEREYLTDLEDVTFEGVRFTVKDHDTFNETKQTKVSRMYFPDAV